MKRYEKYKDSGVDWIGDIPNHWNIIKVKYLTKIKKGSLPKKIVSNDIGLLPPYMSMEYLRGGDETQWVADKDADIVKKNEILLLWDGSNAGEFIRSRNGVISSTVALVNYVKIDKKFSWYLSKFLEIKLRQNTNGMGIPHVDGNYLKNLKVSLPNSIEQEAIAEFLDDKTVKIDQTISLKQKEINLLKERRQIVIQKVVTKGLNDQVKMKDSGVDWIGEIPEHWDVKANRLLFIERNQPGNANLPLLSVSLHSGVSKGELNEDENIRGKIKIEDKSSYKIVEVNDIVFNMMRAWQGAIGSVSIRGMVSPAYIVACPKAYFDSQYFQYQFRTESYIQEINKNSKGITDFRKRLYWNEFRKMLTISPPTKEQNLIVDYLNSLEKKIDGIIFIKQQEIEKLKEYKTVLIDNVVTGKVKVIA